MILAAVGVAGALFVVLRDDGGGSDATPATGPAAPGAEGQPERQPGGSPEPRKPAVSTIRVRNGEPVGGVRTLNFTRGERIRFRIASDAAAEVHLHGYDVLEDVPAGGRVGFDVRAKIEGVFEVELEGTHVQIAEVRVEP